MKRSVLVLCASVLLGYSFAARADVRLPPVISDHMVLQRDMSAPIWGSATPGEQVTVSIAGQTKTATADALAMCYVLETQ